MKKFISQKDMRIANIFEVLSLIRREKTVTRKEIQKLMGLSWGGVSQIVSRLLELSYVVEEKSTDNTTSGRKPGCIEVNAADNFIVGIDVNVTGLYAVVMNLKNEIIYEEYKKPDRSNKGGFLRSVYEVLDSVMEKYKENKIMTLGVAMQGEVDAENGISLGISVKEWKNVPLGELLSERYDVPVYITHDPDCILSAASRENKEDAILVRVDEGLGMAVMKNGSLIVGAGMHEIGMCNVVSNGESELLHKVFYGNERSLDEKISALSYVVGNAVILYNVKKLLVCGNVLDKDELFDKFKSLTEKYAGRSIDARNYDVKRAAFGAAIFAIDDYLKYIK